jgi:hypothetical protein
MKRTYELWVRSTLWDGRPIRDRKTFALHSTEFWIVVKTHHLDKYSK